MNELIDGGSVTIYDAIGTPANLQLRWAKTDSVANGGADTWELFYQTNSTATAAKSAWQNAGSDFVFDANWPVESADHEHDTHRRVTINGTSLGNITINSPTGGITQFANTSGVATVNNLQQNGFAAGQLKSIAVSDAGNIIGTFSNGQNVALAQVPLVHFNSPNNLKALDGGAYQLTDRIRSGDGRLVGQDHRTIPGSLKYRYCDGVHKTDRDPAGLFGKHQSDHDSKPDVAGSAERDPMIHGKRRT